MELSAHERAMRRRANFIESNPNAVSPQERAGVMQWQHNQGLTGREKAMQAFERGMLGDKIKGEVDVAHEKRLGMENQGVAAAKLRYGYVDENGNRVDGSDVLSEKERQLGQKNVTRIQGENSLKVEEARQSGALKQSELEWGRSNPDGTRTVGGRESVAQAEGKARVDAAKAQAEAAAQEAATKRALEEQKIRAAQEKEKARLKLSYDRLDAKTKNDIDAAAARIEKEQGIGHEDAISQVMAGREQSGQQDGGEAWPGYTAEKTAELKKRGYTLVNGKPVKNG